MRDDRLRDLIIAEWRELPKADRDDFNRNVAFAVRKAEEYFPNNRKAHNTIMAWIERERGRIN